MTKKYAEKIVLLQIEKGIIEKDKEITYIFGYQLFIGKILSTMLMILIAGMTGTIAEIFLLMAALIPLRQYAGGAHFAKGEMCIFFSALLSFIIVIGWKTYFGIIPLYIWLGIEIISAIIIWIAAPVGTKNKRLDEEEKRVFAVRTKVVLLIEFFIIVICSWLQIPVLSITIILTHAIVMGGVVLAYVIELFEKK